MAYNNGIVSAPVSIYDVQRALGVSTSDLGTLCTSAMINIWAKFKPVRWLSPDTLAALNSDKTWNTGTAEGNKWWKARDGQYGLSYSAITVGNITSGMRTALNSLAGLITGGVNGWVHADPRGHTLTYNEYYRLTDFNQYNHNVDRPVRSVSTHNINAGVNEEYSIGVNFIETVPSSIDSRDYLRPDDIASETLHRGLAFYKLVNGAYSCIGWCTDVNWVGTGIKGSDWSQDYEEDAAQGVAITYLKTGNTYYVLPLYFSAAFAQPAAGQSLLNTTSGVKVIPMPYTNIMSFTATQSALTVELSNKNVDINYNFDSTVSVVNTGNTSVTCAWETAIVNELFTGSWDSGTYIGSTLDSGTTTFAGGGMTTFLKRFQLLNGELTSNHTWKVYVNLDGTPYYISLRQPSIN